MPATDPRVDAYIARSAEFARPILTHLRALVHKGCPGVEETIKWGMPHFMYEGQLAGMAAFKAHCTFGFWKASLIFRPSSPPSRTAMGQYGRITSMSDLPPRTELLRHIRRAAQVNEQGLKVPARKSGVKKPALRAPADLTRALATAPKARATFAGFSPSHKREYIAWIEEAKRDETRARRVAQAVEWMREGRHRNWKYER